MGIVIVYMKIIWQFVQQNYEYALVVAGVIIEGYAIMTSDDENKNTGWLILAIILITVGCIIRSVNNI